MLSKPPPLPPESEDSGAETEGFFLLHQTPLLIYLGFKTSPRPAAASETEGGGYLPHEPPPYFPYMENHPPGRISARSYTSLGLIWDPLFEQNPSFLQGFIRFWLQKGVQNRAGLRPAELAAAGRNGRGGFFAPFRRSARSEAET